MIVAYADPPYPGVANRYPEKTEVDHGELVARLCAVYSGGWALSTSSAALRDVLALCPPDVRVMAWVKPFAVFKRGVWVAYAWEPVIVRGGRPRSKRRGFVHDWVSASAAMNQRRHGVLGSKPAQFCCWLFEVLGLEPDDELHDLYPGSGAVTRAWETWRRQQRLALTP